MKKKFVCNRNRLKSVRVYITSPPLLYYPRATPSRINETPCPPDNRLNKFFFKGELNPVLTSDVLACRSVCMESEEVCLETGESWESRVSRQPAIFIKRWSKRWSWQQLKLTKHCQSPIRWTQSIICQLDWFVVLLLSNGHFIQLVLLLILGFYFEVDPPQLTPRGPHVVTTLWCSVSRFVGWWSLVTVPMWAFCIWHLATAQTNTKDLLCKL